MSLRKNLAIKSFAVSVITILLMGTALIVNAQSQTETEKKLKEFQDKHPDRIEVFAKILNVDPIKGDVTLRLEFFPEGNLVKDDGTLAKTIKFDTESANGKSEITFEKGKRMHASEVVLTMFGLKKEGSDVISKVEHYPFDAHQADLYLYFFTKPDKKKEAPKDPAKTEESTDPKVEVEEDDEAEIPHFLVFTDVKIGVPVAPGYTITTTTSKESNEYDTRLTLNIARSIEVKLFAIFIMLLMWSVTLAVLGLVIRVVFMGRKAELAMFSFIATLLFAFVTVRNSQPGVPPVGTFSDNLSFFWAEGILGMCLLAVVLTWVFRKQS